jgi:hypothetical protein
MRRIRKTSYRMTLPQLYLETRKNPATTLGLKPIGAVCAVVHVTLTKLQAHDLL